jgi:membrane-bound inhibitor of C-type lysozyme
MNRRFPSGFARARSTALGTCLAGSLLAAACAGPQPACDCASVSLYCEDGERLWARFTTEVAYLNLDHRTLRLQQVPAASGARYTDGRVTLWSKGEQVRIEIGDDPATARHCTIGG